MPRAFLRPETQERVREAVAEIESQTSVEVVVTLRKAAALYRDTDYGVGFALSLFVLWAMLYVDIEFPLLTFVPASIATFVVGAFLSSRLDGLKRILVGAKQARWQAEQTARATFYETGVSRTRRREGILVFIALLEREVVVLCDTGLDDATLGKPWEEAKNTLERTLTRSPDVETLIAHLKGLGPALAKVRPRRNDDVNELSDDVVIVQRTKGWGGRAAASASPAGRSRK